MPLTEPELIHPSAVIDPEADLALDVRIGPYAIIEGPVQLGPGTGPKAIKTFQPWPLTLVQSKLSMFGSSRKRNWKYSVVCGPNFVMLVSGPKLARQ